MDTNDHYIMEQPPLHQTSPFKIWKIYNIQVKESGATRKRVYEQKYTLPNGVQADRVTSTINSEGVLTINAPKGKAAASSMNQTIEQKMDRILSPSAWTDHANLTPNRSLVDTDDLFGDNSGLSRYVLNSF